jgi:hypothetical protein
MPYGATRIILADAYPTDRSDGRLGFASDQHVACDHKLRCAMASVVYRCPLTGKNVQAWFAAYEAADDDLKYVSLRCPACARLHLVNRSTGRTL